MADIDVLREVEEKWLSEQLAFAIQNLAYPVGCGIAPQPYHMECAAKTLFERYAKMIEMARSAAEKEAESNHRSMAKLLAETGRERDVLQIQVGVLKRALEPFGAQADCWPEIPDNQAMMTSNGEDLSSVDFTMSDLRIARSLSTANTGGEE